MPVINLKEATRNKDAKEMLSKLEVDFESDQPALIHCYWKHISFIWTQGDKYIEVILSDMPLLIPIPGGLERNSDSVKVLIACFLNRLY